MLLSRDNILTADDLETEDVAVPEWAPQGVSDPSTCMVRLRMLTGTERDKFERMMAEAQAATGSKRKAGENFRARMVSMCAVDERGNKLFNTNDIATLGTKSSKALSRVFDACQRMNGFTESDVEELTEGFDESPSEVSTSD